MNNLVFVYLPTVAGHIKCGFFLSIASSFIPIANILRFGVRGTSLKADFGAILSADSAKSLAKNAG